MSFKNNKKSEICIDVFQNTAFVVVIVVFRTTFSFKESQLKLSKTERKIAT